MTLLETLNDMTKDGLFIKLAELLPWLDESKAIDLNMEFYLNRGGKRISPLYENLIKMYPLVDDQQSRLASILCTKFGTSWTRVYEALNAEYNPIHNYDMQEKVASNTNVSNTSSSNSTSNSSSEVSNNNVTEVDTTVTTDSNNTVTKNYYGFNDDVSQPVNDGSNKTDSSTLNKGTTSQKDSNISKDSGVLDSSNVSVTTANEADNYQITTRSGNIGVTTTQQMLNAELELRKNIFFESMFNDIDSLICLGIY